MQPRRGNFAWKARLNPPAGKTLIAKFKEKYLESNRSIPAIFFGFRYGSFAVLNLSKQAKKRRAQGMESSPNQRLKKKSPGASAETKKRDLSRVIPIGAKLTDILKSGALIQGFRKIAQYEGENLSL